MITMIWPLHVSTNNDDDEYDEGNVVSSNDESDDHLELGTSTDWCRNNFLAGLSHQGKLNKPGGTMQKSEVNKQTFRSLE